MKFFTHLTSAVILTASILIASPVFSAEYKGTCYFNKKAMPCKVRQNPYTKTMIWEDGVVEVYVHQGKGVFVDKRGGIWRPDPMNPRYMVHDNGNRIGFYEH